LTRPTLIAAAAALALMPAAHAMELDSSNPDTKIRLDFTPKYSMAYRLKNPSAGLTSPLAKGDGGVTNENDGDLNFNKGAISSRLDLLTEFDVSSKGWGLRISDAAWYDAKYVGSNANDGMFGVNNAPSQAPNQFIDATRTQQGRANQLLDAFVYVKGHLGEMPASVRVGKHALQYGESLFFGQNGIAAAQGPVDVAKILSVPGWQFKEVLLPVEQISGTVQIADGLTLGGYYQLKWRPSRIPGVGSYFSNQDYIGGGRVWLGPTSFLPTDDSKDQRPPDHGQFGGQLRWSPEGGNYEFGLYAARYHDKTPAVPVFDFVNFNNHSVYAQGIKTFGASVSSSIGQLNWAAEGSVRWNAPLTSDPAALVGAPGTISVNCDGTSANPCFAIGKTAHLNLSGIYVLQKSGLWDGGVVLAELAWNRVLSVTKDPVDPAFGVGGRDRNTTRDAAALRMIFEPQYFQVLPGLDLSVPLGLGYNFAGRSGAVVAFAGGTSKAGDVSIGVKGKYQNTWNFGLTYTAYIGEEATFTTPLTGPTDRVLSFGQSLKDRNYLSFTVSRTF
jgi:hypothetical protein